MSNDTIFCQKYQTYLPKLTAPPYPNALGQRLQENISAKAWGDWLALQTMLINEKHLSTLEPTTRDYLNTQRDLFLSNGDYDKPTGYKAPQLPDASLYTEVT